MSKLSNTISILAITLFLTIVATSQATAGGTLYVDDDASAGGDGILRIDFCGMHSRLQKAVASAKFM